MTPNQRVAAFAKVAGARAPSRTPLTTRRHPPDEDPAGAGALSGTPPPATPKAFDGPPPSLVRPRRTPASTRPHPGADHAAPPDAPSATPPTMRPQEADDEAAPLGGLPHTPATMIRRPLHDDRAPVRIQKLSDHIQDFACLTLPGCSAQGRNTAALHKE